MKKNNNKYFVWGYYGYNNIGEDLLIKIIHQSLKKKGFLTSVLSQNDTIKEVLNDDEASYFTLSYRGHPLLKHLRTIKFFYNVLKLHDKIIFGGGTQLYESKKNGLAPLIIIYLVLLMNKIFFKREIIHLCVGLGSPKSNSGRLLVKNIINLSNLIILRDEKSFDLAKKMSKKKDTVLKSYDLVYAIELKKEKIEKNSINLGLSLFQYYEYIEFNSQKALKFENQIISMIKDLLKNQDLKITLFSFQKQYGGDDSSFNDRIIKKISNDRLYHVDYRTNTSSFLDEFKSMDFNIGMRLHFNILSFVYNINSVGINYHDKIQREYISFNYKNKCIDIESIDEIVAIFNQFMTNPIEFNLKNQIIARKDHVNNILEKHL
jgi:polysaccharide pyruvyl transferase WcaK-like protein